MLPVAVVVAWLPLGRIDSRVQVPLREIRLLRLTPEFVPLPAPQLEVVARRTRWVTVEPGQALIREGDAGDRYYVLESGRLRVTIDGREVRIFDQAGTGMGEIALLHNVRRTATLTAMTPCVLLALERSDFLEAVTGHEATHAVVRETAAGHTIGKSGRAGRAAVRPDRSPTPGRTPPPLPAGPDPGSSSRGADRWRSPCASRGSSAIRRSRSGPRP